MKTAQSFRDIDPNDADVGNSDPEYVRLSRYFSPNSGRKLRVLRMMNS